MGKTSEILAELAQEKWDRSRGYFEPNKCDADAFMAMVAFGLRVETNENGQVYVWNGDELIWNSIALHCHSIAERVAATRRAICRAMAHLREQELSSEGDK